MDSPKQQMVFLQNWQNSDLKSVSNQQSNHSKNKILISPSNRINFNSAQQHFNNLHIHNLTAQQNFTVEQSRQKRTQRSFISPRIQKDDSQIYRQVQKVYQTFEILEVVQAFVHLEDRLVQYFKKIKRQKLKKSKSSQIGKIEPFEQTELNQKENIDQINEKINLIISQFILDLHKFFKPDFNQSQNEDSSYSQKSKSCKDFSFSQKKQKIISSIAINEAKKKNIPNSLGNIIIQQNMEQKTELVNSDLKMIQSINLNQPIKSFKIKNQQIQMKKNQRNIKLTLSRFLLDQSIDTNKTESKQQQKNIDELRQQNARLKKKIKQLGGNQNSNTPSRRSLSRRSSQMFEKDSPLVLRYLQEQKQVNQLQVLQHIIQNSKNISIQQINNEGVKCFKFINNSPLIKQNQSQDRKNLIGKRFTLSDLEIVYVEDDKENNQNLMNNQNLINGQNALYSKTTQLKLSHDQLKQIKSQFITNLSLQSNIFTMIIAPDNGKSQEVRRDQNGLTEQQKLQLIQLKKQRNLFEIQSNLYQTLLRDVLDTLTKYFKEMMLTDLQIELRMLNYLIEESKMRQGIQLLLVDFIKYQCTLKVDLGTQKASVQMYMNQLVTRKRQMLQRIKGYQQEVR